MTEPWLEPTTEVGGWIELDDVSGVPETVSCLIPQQYEARARVFRSLNRPNERPARWSDVAVSKQVPSASEA